MKKIEYFLFIWFIILNTFNIYFVSATKVFSLKNDDYYFYNLDILINNNQDDDLIINFVDDYYDMSLAEPFNFGITVNHNIALIGNKNGTIFDYNNQGRKGPFKVSIFSDSLTFENITFTNFDQLSDNNVYMIAISAQTEQFHIYINNCSFIENNYDLMVFNFNSKRIIEVDPQIQINNTNFM